MRSPIVVNETIYVDLDKKPAQAELIPMVLKRLKNADAYFSGILKFQVMFVLCLCVVIAAVTIF